MSTGNQSCLRFSLEESVWFQRGQEVAELVSISLDPNITIQENDQYVTIKGSLELTGEYKCADPAAEEAAEAETGNRQVHSVMEREEGYMEFLHRFPVDITIPQNRIESIYDIDITVESFDYDFPERSSLKLSAELAITGLYGDQQHGSDEGEEEFEVPAEAEAEDLEPYFRQTEAVEVPLEVPELSVFMADAEEPELLTADEAISELFTPFKAEARKEPEPEKVKEEKIELNSVRNQQEDSAVNANKNAETHPNEEPVAISPRSEGQVKPKILEPPLTEEPQGTEEPPLTEVSEALEEPPLTDMPEAQEIPEAETQDEGEADASTQLQEEPVLEQSGPVINEKAQQDELESSSAPSPEESKTTSKKASKKKGLSIAEFLARKEDSDVAKIRVCIVQQGDTLQHIAERYEVSVQQLLNINHLGLDQEVSEGQVLHVPAEYAAKGSK